MISIIIPTLNEAQELPETLRRIASNSSPYELLVVDAGSSDATKHIATTAGARLFSSPQAQRAFQQNLGAQHARGDVLLFLHADTWLPANALKHVTAVCADGRVIGGCFEREFRAPSRFLKMTCALATRRGHVFGMFLGDQGIFIRRRAFEALGGFPLFDSFEDVEFSLAMRRAGKTTVLEGPALSSARRFLNHGPVSRTYRDLLLTLEHFRARRAAMRVKRQ